MFKFGRRKLLFLSVIATFGVAMIYLHWCDFKSYEKDAAGTNEVLRDSWMHFNINDVGFATLDDIPSPHSDKINCENLLHMNVNIYKRARRREHYNISTTDNDENLRDSLQDCPAFIQQRRYIEKPISQEEFEFPIAFTIMAYKDAFQVERLLRAIYRPQNLYCIHLDKLHPGTFEILKPLEKCFPNVIVAENRVAVRWSWWSVIEGELVCLKHLLSRNHPWRYYINLTGQEFPLKTNLEIVKILKIYNGANDILGNPFTQPEINARLMLDYAREDAGSPKVKKGPFKHKIKWYKGSLHIAGSRSFMEFILTDQFARDLKEYLIHTRFPDETFYTTLNGNPEYGVPGSYTGDNRGKSLMRYKLWSYFSANHQCRNCKPTDVINYRNSTSIIRAFDPRLTWCYGKFVRYICIIGIGDIKQVVESPYLFVNKLQSTFSPLSYDCLEELLFKRIRSELLGNHTLDLTIYKSMNFVKNHLEV